MQPNLEAPEQGNTRNPGTDQAQTNLRSQAVQGMGDPGSRDLFRRSNPTDSTRGPGTRGAGTDMTATENRIQALIDSGNSNIERLPSSQKGVSEFKVKYSPNAEGKSTSIKLGLNSEGELVKIGNKLAKGEDGIFRSTETGAGKISKQFIRSKNWPIHLSNWTKRR